MSSTPTTPLTLEQKIEAAGAETAIIIQEFSPHIAAIVQAGVQVEPVISSIIQLFKALFTAKVQAAVAPSTPAPPVA